MPTGISGGRIVGYYDVVSSLPSQLYAEHGFVYDDQSFRDLDVPAPARNTHPNGISGGNIVGDYTDTAGKLHGFLYDGNRFATLDDPLASSLGKGTLALGIDGHKVVGQYSDASSFTHGFLYNGSTYRTIDDPSNSPQNPGDGTILTAISGNNIVGYSTSSYSYFDGRLIETVNIYHGFLFDGTKFATINSPFGQAGSSQPTGIDGAKIVGICRPGFDTQTIEDGFLYNGDSYIRIASGQIGTEPHDIDGDFIVGTAKSGGTTPYGFLAVIPEPSTWVLMSLGISSLLLFKRRSWLCLRRILPELAIESDVVSDSHR
jgi:hypothetical protein